MLGLGAASLVHPGAWGPVATLVSLLLGATSLGAVLVGMVIGHWYLVTPTLSTRPLLGMTAAFLAAAALQGVLLPLQMGLVGGDAGRAAGTAALLGTYGLAFWLRVLVGIAFPVTLGVMTSADLPPALDDVGNRSVLHRGVLCAGRRGHCQDALLT